MTARRLDHVAIATPSLEAAAAGLERFGLSRVGDDERIAAAGTVVRCFAAGGALIELVAPIEPTSPLVSFLDDHGPGLHHIALRVDELDAEVARLREMGADFLTDEPFAGRAGTRVAFVLPACDADVLIELVEHP